MMPANDELSNLDILTLTAEDGGVALLISGFATETESDAFIQVLDDAAILTPPVPPKPKLKLVK